MDILFSAAVLAALITSLVNLRLAVVNARNARDLESFKQTLSLEIAKQLEISKAKLRADEIAFSRLWELRLYLKSNNISSLALSAGPINDESFTKLCLHDVPTLFMEYTRRIDECSVYLRVDRLKQISETADRVRLAMKALADAPQAEKRESANKMLTLFAEYNTIVEKQVDEALEQGLDDLRR